MTRSKKDLPSFKGIKGKILNGKVIGLIIVFIISLFFIFTFYCYTHKQTNIITSSQKLESYENSIAKKYALKIEKKQEYEEVTYQLNKIIELGEKNHISTKIQINIGDSIEDIIIKKYDFFAKYYKINNFLFKHQEDANNFINKIKQYDNQEYSIETTKDFIKQETKKEDIDIYINNKKQEYEAELAKQKAKEEARKKALEEQNKKKKQEQSTTYISNSYSLSELQQYAHNLVLNEYGWSEYDFQCLVNLWNKESGWNPNSHNSSSGAHGIPQALPASKMASEGADYYTNGETQIRWGLKYIAGRYGTPANAWGHFQSVNWY